MKPWRTVPGSVRHSVAAGAAATASAASHGASRQSVEGSSIMPPSSPCSGRRRSSTAPSAPGQPERDAVAQRPLRLLGLRRQVLGNPERGGGAIGAPRAQHAARPRAACTAPRPDPSSPARNRRPAAPAPARRRGRAAAALPRGSGVRSANSRATTRSTLPSTAATRPVEGDRRDRRRGVIADAGQARATAPGRPGNRPPCAATTACAQACRLRARA